MKTNKDLLVTNARLIDGTGGPVQSDLSIKIRAGRIAQIEKAIASNGDMPVLDAEGAYVLPGLIDSHVHLMWGPGAAIQNHDEPNKENWGHGWGTYLSHYLKAYLACGITTVLDVGAFPYVVNNVRKYLQEGHPGPRVLHLGPCLAPPGGYGGLFECPAATPDEVDMQQ